MDAEFAIGAPWWDYFLPHILSRAVETVYYPRPTPFYRMRHTTDDPLSIRVHYGEQFLRYLDRGLAERLAETPGLGYKTETLATVTQQFASYFFSSCKARSPIEWAAPALYGNGSHSQIEELKNRMRQWADRAVLAEELLQQWARR